MRDVQVVVVAVAAWLGACWGAGPPLAVAVAAVAVALVARRPWLLCVAALLLTGARAQADLAGLRGAPSGPYRGWVELTTDPVTDVAGTVTVDARIGRRLGELKVRGAGAAAMRARAAGDLVLVQATLRPAPLAARWLTRRHLAMQGTVTDVGDWRDGKARWRVANAARDALARSATALPERQRGLYLGLVLGDDRDEPADIADDFRGAGLAHLLAVSGQNVAFVLALAGPLVRRASLRGRLGVTMAVLGLFVLATRAEPSVLRAAGMAGIAAVATTLGREASGIRVLSLAVTVLLVADPFLVWSLGFQLSTAASAAILLLAPPIAARVPGPRAVAEAVGVSAAAQLGVAPLLVTTFGGVPVAALVANVLAAPAAGPVMAWGIVAGLVGGVLGPSASLVLHLPTRVLVWWLASVARWAARLPLGQLGLPGLVALAGAVAGHVLGRRFGVRSVRVAAAALGVAALTAPGLALRDPPSTKTALGAGADLWQASGAVLVVDGRARVDAVLEGLRTAGLDRVDLVVERSSSAAAEAVVAAVRQRGDVGAVVGPDVPRAGEVAVGRLVVHLEPSRGGLSVDVGVAR